MTAVRLRLPLPAEPATDHQTDTLDAEVSEDWSDAEVTRRQVDPERVLRELGAALSAVESLTSAAETAAGALAWGRTADRSRRERRVVDLIAAARAAAARALELGESLRSAAGG